jgi:hypothetical protein
MSRQAFIPQSMDIVVMTIHGVVCQKLTFTEIMTFEIPKCYTLYKLQQTNFFSPKYASLSKVFWCKKLTPGALPK